MPTSLGLFSLTVYFLLLGCSNPAAVSEEKLKSFKEGSYGFDLQFLRKFDSVIVLKDQRGMAQVIVSPKYQGKVFTSTAEGYSGKSFGWINYKAFTATQDPHMNAYGGENRFWLGPEGGPFSIFFSKGEPMRFEHWKTPAPIDTEAWTLAKKDSHSVELHKSMTVYNYAGTELNLSTSRSIMVLDSFNIATIIHGEVDTSLKCVGYATTNTIKNEGTSEWNEKTGMPCIWILDMFTPSEKTTIIIPIDSSQSNGSIITTNYFGEIPPNRIKIERGVLFFKADGKYRSKLGVKPSHARNVVGSYDGESNVLTITYFDLDKNGKYLNQEWVTNKPTFSGDAVNAYNDGPLENGDQLGPFYELESVSPAAFLKPGGSLTHHHTVLHFTGNKSKIEAVSKKVFGIGLTEIENALKNLK